MGKRELVETMMSANEYLKLDLSHESRETRLTKSLNDSEDVARLQRQVEIYIKKVDDERAKIKISFSSYSIHNED